MTSTGPNGQVLKSSHRRLLAGLTLLLLAVFLCGVISIPFLYESPSIKYKFGWDKVMLRAGKILGLVAGVLLLLQLSLAGRLKFLDRIFSLPGLYRIHRFNGILIGILIMLHPVLVTLPENRFMVPFEKRYWPEWVGIGLLLVVLVQVAGGLWRRIQSSSYERWLFWHRLMGWSMAVLLMIHVLFVSETFEYQGLPRNAALMAAFAAATLWLVIRGQRPWAKRSPFTVSRIKPAGADAHVIEMKPIGHKPLRYMPGQFAYVSFISGHLSREWHPFTLSSSPTRKESIEISVRDSGDWTRRVETLAPGDRAYVHGPFGRFSHLLEHPGRELILIAGGIGITPMLSMLRAMSDHSDRRRVILLWSDKTVQRQFVSRELEGMTNRLPNFTWTPVLTGERARGAAFGRLDKNRLKTLLAGSSRDAAVFLCGPPQMIRQVRRHLIAIGFPASSIRKELFGL